MRSVIVCLLSLLIVPALSAPAGNDGLPSLSSHPPSNPHAPQKPRIQLAPINPPSTRPSSTRLPSIHQLHIPQPPRRQPPVAHPPSQHGRFVAFQAVNGPHLGMTVGSHPDQQNKFTVAPVKILGHDPDLRPVLAAPYNQVVKVHPHDLVGTRASAPNVASHLMDAHAHHPPTEFRPAGPVQGSRNHFALHGSGRPSGGGQ